MLDLTNRGYPGENEWQLWCQCHNKRGMTCGMMTPIHPGLQHQNKSSHLGWGVGGTVTDLQFRPNSNKTVHQRNTDIQIF